MATTYRDRHGNTIELPKLTLAMSDQMDEIEQTESNRERYQMQLDYLTNVLGEQYVKEELEGSTIDDVDLVMLNVLYVAIVNAYALPVQQAQLEAMKRQMTQVQPMLGSLNSIADIAKIPSFNRSRQGFRNVK